MITGLLIFGAVGVILGGIGMFVLMDRKINPGWTDTLAFCAYFFGLGIYMFSAVSWLVTS